MELGLDVKHVVGEVAVYDRGLFLKLDVLYRRLPGLFVPGLLVRSRADQLVVDILVSLDVLGAGILVRGVLRVVVLRLGVLRVVVLRLGVLVLHFLGIGVLVVPVVRCVSLGVRLGRVVGIEYLAVGAGDAVNNDACRLLEGSVGSLGHGTEVAVDRTGVEAQLCQTLLNLLDLVAHRAAAVDGGRCGFLGLIVRLFARRIGGVILAVGGRLGGVTLGIEVVCSTVDLA